MPEPVCEMQTPALFTMAQSSPQPHSVDTANYVRVNPLPSPATSSSSSDELHLCIESDTSSPSAPVGPPSSSQELLLQRDQPVPQPSSIFGTTTHTSIPTSQPPPQSTSISSWADEVATAEQSGRSTPETVVPNWEYSGRIRGSRGPQPPSSRGKGNPFAPTQGIVHRAPGLNFHSLQFTNSLGIDTIKGVHVPERINDTSTPPQHALKPTASSCSLGQLENECVQEGRDRDLPLECLHFPINPRFTERFWHQSKYFFRPCGPPERLLERVLHP